MNRIGDLRLSPGMELIQLDERRCVVRLGDGGALVLEGVTAGSVARCAEAVRASVVEDPRTRALATSLTRARILVEAPPPPAAPSLATAGVLVLGNGALGAALHASLRDHGVDAALIVPAEGPVPRQDALAVRQAACDVRIPIWEDRAALAARFEGSDLVICALEGVVMDALLDLAELARSTTTICLFVVTRSTAIEVGPTLVPGASPCLPCASVARYRDPEIRTAMAAGLPGLGVYRVGANQRLAAAGAVFATTREALAVLSPTPVPALFASLSRVDADGHITVERFAGTAGCATCTARAVPPHSVSVQRVAACVSRLRLDWGEPDLADQVHRLAATLDHGDGDASGWLQRSLVELGRRGAGAIGHTVTSLLAHLENTCDLLGHWGQPPAIRRAGLFHSIYGTDTFHAALFLRWERPRVRELIGEAAELLVFLFCSVDRASLRAQLETDAVIPRDGVVVRNRATGESLAVPAVVCAALLTIELANLMEQAHAGGGAPAVWVARARRWSGLIASASRALPLFPDANAPLDDAAEEHARGLYLQAPVRFGSTPAAEELAAATGWLEQAVAINPWVGEPHLLLARCLLTVSPARAARHAQHGLAILRRWGVAWDKRCPHRDWTRWGESLLTASQETAT